MADKERRSLGSSIVKSRIVQSIFFQIRLIEERCEWVRGLLGRLWLLSTNLMGKMFKEIVGFEPQIALVYFYNQA